MTRADAVAAALVRVLEWPLPQGTVETYSLPKWLAKEARAALEAYRADEDDSE
jgi:hypothetical protein